MRSVLLILSATFAIAAGPPAKLPLPGDIVAAARPDEWQRIAPDDLMIVDLANGERIAIVLAPAFAPDHVARIRALVRAHWFDGSTINRVQDNYVVQWGQADETKPLPPGTAGSLPAEYDRPATGLMLTSLPYRDTFAPRTGYAGPFPVAIDGSRAWMTHCYGIVGVGRGLHPDTGNGAELYAVLGHSPRQLDRNIALVGRVVDGFEHMTALPRGTGALGFYEKAEQRYAIRRVVIAADLPADARPAYESLRPDSRSFAAWLHLRANRHDDFYERPAGAIDLCGALPPVQAVKG